MRTFFTKATHWLQNMCTTRTVHGPWLYFQRAYSLHTLASLLHRLHLPFAHTLRQHLETTYNTEAVIRNRLGSFSINAKNDSLTKSISTFEYHHQTWLAAPKERNVFIDIGANIGFYSLLALKRYDYQTAHAFEPNPETYERLQKNIELNRLQDTVHTHQVALASHVGTTHFAANPTHTGASSLTTEATAGTITVPTNTFDRWAEEKYISPANISFIKIDVEGFELGVLQGMSQTLPALRAGTTIFIEVAATHPDAVTVHTLLQENGFVKKRSTAQHNHLYIKS